MLLTTSQVKIICSIHIVLADILVTKIKQGLGDTLPSNVTAFEKPEPNQEQPQNWVRAQPCCLCHAKSWLSSWWLPQPEAPSSLPAQCWLCPCPAVGLLELIRELGQNEGNSQGQPSPGTQTRSGPPREAWPMSPKSHTPYPEAGHYPDPTLVLPRRTAVRQANPLMTAARNKKDKPKINPNLNASLPTFYSIPHMPQRAQAISTFSFAVAVLIKTHSSFPVTFLHIFERMLSATTKYLAWILQWGGAKGSAHVLKTKEILP